MAGQQCFLQEVECSTSVAVCAVTGAAIVVTADLMTAWFVLLWAGGCAAARVTWPGLDALGFMMLLGRQNLWVVNW